MKKYYGVVLVLLVLVFSILVMILPTFFTKGVSRVALQKELLLPLVLNDEKDVKLVFFGYSGCVNICSPRLEAISNFYKTLDSGTKKKFGIEFFDISKPYDKELPSLFVQAFHEDFKGIYLEDSILRVYTRAFNVYFSPSLKDKGEFNHSSHLFLVQKKNGKKTLRYIYNAYPFDFKQIHLDIEELLNEI